MDTAETEVLDLDAIRPADPPPAPWGLSRVLRLCTGVREEILSQVPSERARYTSMGGVVLGTAVMAMLSMSVALYSVFGGFQWFILVAVPVWGMFILSLDRWLMSTTSMGQAGRAFSKLAPRLLLSIALGVILAEPLLLGLYHTAIEERIAKDRQAEVVNRESDLRTCNPVPGTPEADRPEAHAAKCDGLRLAVGSSSPVALQKQYSTLKEQADALQQTVDADAKAYGDLEEKARRECNGTPGTGLTGIYGAGVNCNRLRNEATQYRQDHRIDQNEQKLADLRKQMTEVSNKTATATNDYSAVVAKAIQEDVAKVKARQGKIGLLERFRALDLLVSENAYVATTQWALRIFFIIVDALPVLLKIFNGTTSYDRILDGRLHEQERIQQLRSSEELDKHIKYGEVVRRHTDAFYREQQEQIERELRARYANLDEARGRLIDAFENHLMRTAIGPATESWDPERKEPPIYDPDGNDYPTQPAPPRKQGTDGG